MANTRQNGLNEVLKRAASALAEQSVDAVLVEITSASGSTPRNEGTGMLVTPERIFATVGGGQLELIAIEKAREMLSGGTTSNEITLPLGPDIGQCCGGKVTLSFTRLDHQQLETLSKSAPVAALPEVQIHGAGHTGKALARALSLLPFRTRVIDSRNDMLIEVIGDVEKLHTALPEAEVEQATPGAAFVVLTHEHRLDFMIAAQALSRKDAAYVGMIGSKTKRAVFANWLKSSGFEPDLIDRLYCPIGGSAVRDKRPEIIAGLVAAELIGVLAKPD